MRSNHQKTSEKESIEDRIRDFSHQTRSTRRKIERLEEKRRTLGKQAQHMYHKAGEIHAKLQQYDKALQQWSETLQGEIDKELQETAKKLAQRNEVCCYLKKVEQEESLVAFDERFKKEFAELYEAHLQEFSGVLGKTPLGSSFFYPVQFPINPEFERAVAHARENVERRKKAKGTEEALNDFKKELAEPLLVRAFLQSPYWYPPRDPFFQREWEKTWCEIYLPVFFKRRSSGLPGKLEKAVREAFPPEIELCPFEYKDLLRIDLQMDRAALREKLNNLLLPQFAEANVVYQLVDIDELLEQEETVVQKLRYSLKREKPSL